MIPQTGNIQNPIQGGFPPQMNRAMQSSPIPGRPQMSMGMNDPAQQAAIQQQRAQQQQSAMFQQRAQQRPANGVPLPDDLSTLSPPELEQVSRLANQMLSKTSPEDMEKIKSNLNNMNREQRDYLSRKNMDPMTYFFRSQALTNLRRQRRIRMEQAAGRQTSGGMDPNTAMLGDPTMNQRQVFQNMMGLQRNSFSGSNPSQGIDTSGFIGNVENIQGQQADGMRSQEAGQLVVPASSSQMNHQPFNNGQNMFPQQMGQTGQGNMSNMNGTGVNAQMFGQQHPQNGSNGTQDRMQFQAQQSQAQAVQAQARTQAAHKAQLAMSGHGGQSNPQPQSHLPQSSPVMPMLNQPMASGQMSPAQVPGQPRPPSRPPNMGQQQTGMQGGPQPGMQGRPQIPPNLPQAVQDQLSHMTNEQLHNFLLGQRRAAIANNNMARNTNQQSASQNGQAPAMFNGQMGNNARMRNQMNLQQGMNAGPSQAQQIQGQQQLTAQQRQQRHNEIWRQQLMHHNDGMEMTVEQGKQMDRTNFPPTMINKSTSQVPNNIRTWGQLKQWAAANPQASNGVDLGRLMTLQKLHLTQVLSAKNSSGQGPGGPTHAFQGAQNPISNGQNFPGGQTQGPVNMAMRPITSQDIHVARQKLGLQAQTLTDDQLREVLRSRQRQVLLQAHARNQANGNMSATQSQMMAQPAITATQNATHVNPPVMPQPMQTIGEVQPSNAKSQPVGGPSKGGKTPTGKQAPKKRLNEETGEARIATTMPQQPLPATSATAASSRLGLQFTQEQYLAMGPQQRVQVEIQMRRHQQHLLRGPIPSKDQAEEAWQKVIPNLPPHLQQMYQDLKAAPLGNPQPVTPEQKSAMIQQIMENLDVTSKLDSLVLQSIAKAPAQEKNLKSVLAMHVQLMRQFKPGPEWVLNDHFTITPDYLSGTMLFIRKLFQLILMRASQRPNGNQPLNSTAPVASTAQGGNTALNATNLQQLQQQEEAFQRARRASSQSAAVAPAPFGAPSPQGVPHAYGPGGLAPEKLKLPPPKKRKQSNAGVSASPVQSSVPVISAAAAKYTQAVGDVRSTVAALAGAFKCSVVECQHHVQGFATQAALDKHVHDTHQPEEEAIGDPMQYYVDSLNVGLGLDGQLGSNQSATTGPVPVPSITTTTNTNVNRTNAVASPANQGLATPGTANTTPMARASSQLGTRTASPAISTQQLTPQPGPSRDAKSSPGQDGTQQTRKRTHDESEASGWEYCPLSVEKIHDAFEPVFSSRGSEDPERYPDDDVHVCPEPTAEEEARWEAWLTPWTEELIQKCSKWTGIPREMMFSGNEDDVLESKTSLNQGGAIAIAAV